MDPVRPVAQPGEYTMPAVNVSPCSASSAALPTLTVVTLALLSLLRNGSVTGGRTLTGPVYSSFRLAARTSLERVARRRSSSVGRYVRPPFQLVTPPLVE